MKRSSTPAPHDRAAQPSPSSGRTGEQRLDCTVCNHRVDHADASAFVTFPCHVRAFFGETFNIWRCPGCQTIHCLDVVDLAHYYAKYPFAGMELTWPFRIFYRHLTHRLTKHGFTRNHSLLDYGCGNGAFVKYLRQRGYARCHGYDPYGRAEGTGDPAVLQHGPFNYILLQDVFEHVEAPNALLADVDGHVAPGGRVFIGTPNAANLDLTRPEEFWNEIHVPYHLHIYTRGIVEGMGRRQGWMPVGFFDRPYHDRPWFGLNTRAAKQYQRLVGGTMDAVLEPVKPLKALASPKFIFYAAVGYWLSFRSDMTVVFEKPRADSRERSAPSP
ncbi:MAG: class I SAM-dependent methyltransferase [Phycisphaerae bacterium]|nr:class I SAM-dependent methyltransferase [Phycisphaerae bacterium]